MRSEKNPNFKSRSKGFTLIELLVVMVIIGILAIISFANFQTSQVKSRDAQRKSDLRQIFSAMEAYMSDHGSYPISLNGLVQTGKIKSCGGCDSSPTLTFCEWSGVDNREFCDSHQTVYMQMVPGDPSANPNYCYDSDGTSFKVYARLENTKDPDCISHDAGGNCLNNKSCVGNMYNFGMASGNTTL